MESLWSTLKIECGEDAFRKLSYSEAELRLFDYIETFYNSVRLHGSQGYLSPRDFETMFRPEPATHLAADRKPFPLAETETLDQ